MRANIGKFALALTLIGLVVLFTDHDKDVPDPAFLSRDMFFNIGEGVITVPVVAILDVSTPPNNNNSLPRYSHSPIFGKGREFATNEYKAAMINFAADPAAPANVSGIKLSIEVYGSYGEYTVSSQICSLLTKPWSQKVCINEFPDAIKTMPRRFRLTTEDGLGYYHRMSFSGISNVRGNDLLEAMGPLSTQAKTACTVEREFCKSATAVSDDLYAVWSSGCRQLTIESCERANIVKGNAIRDFVQNQLMVK